MPGEINGTQCYITVDTGSNISTVWTGLLIRSTNISMENCWLRRTVTGERAPALGKKKLQLNIGALEV